MQNDYRWAQAQNILGIKQAQPPTSHDHMENWIVLFNKLSMHVIFKQTLAV